MDTGISVLLYYNSTGCRHCRSVGTSRVEAAGVACHLVVVVEEAVEVMPPTHAVAALVTIVAALVTAAAALETDDAVLETDEAVLETDNAVLVSVVLLVGASVASAYSSSSFASSFHLAAAAAAICSAAGRAFSCAPHAAAPGRACPSPAYALFPHSLSLRLSPVVSLAVPPVA